MTASALAAAPAAFAGGDDRGGSFSNNETSGNFSVLGGNQVFVPISAPINACGNAVAVFGVAGAGCKAEAEVEFE
ncbi:chaplin [Actinomadura sp. WMMB 499]|nr:chaplin [Actinomadura sp. WMMB 499]